MPAALIEPAPSSRFKLAGACFFQAYALIFNEADRPSSPHAYQDHAGCHNSRCRDSRPPLLLLQYNDT